jgi:signal transduction histidine kinase
VVSHSIPGTPTIPVFLWLIRDLTAQHRLEREQQRAAHLRLLGTLASSVSHDIRDPLSAIALFTELLDDEVRQLQLPTAVHTRLLESLAEIQRARLRMQHIVEDYLALARGWDLQREPTALGALLTAFAEDVALACTTQGITCAVEGLAALGVVRLHQSTFRRALLNLVQNAIEAMPQGGTLTLRGRQTATQCILEVCDTGIGIPAEQVPQLFLPLHTTKAQGTGLGLYVVQEILAAHGAELAVQSAPGHGTSFTITLPCEPVPPTPPTAAPHGTPRG